MDPPPTGRCQVARGDTSVTLGMKQLTHLYRTRRHRLGQPLSQHWRNFGIALGVSALAGAAILLIWPDAAGLFLFGLYSIPSNSMIPVPHEPGLLYFAKYYTPLWLAIAGTLGTAVAAFADYEVVGRALAHPKLRAARGTRIYRWAVRSFMAYPFCTVILFSATPLPVYIVRVLAPASGYPIRRYIAALMIGRLPRFYVVAWIGYMVPIPTWVLLLMFIALCGGVVFTASGTTGDREVGELDDEELLVDAA